MNIDCLALGDYQTNCYVIRSNQQSSECIIIDPGFDAGPLVQFLKDNSLTPKKILLTHGHCDHIAGLTMLISEFGIIEVNICKGDSEMLTNPDANLSSMMGMPLQFAPADIFLSPENTIEFDSISITVLTTPGHTPGGVSLYCKDAKAVFVGDTLFAGSIGRTDFPNGNTQQLLDNIRQQLFSLPDNTTVYSGHGPKTTIGQEKMTNPFLK